MPTLLQLLADGFSDIALSPIQPITRGYDTKVENPGDKKLTRAEKKHQIELARRQGGQPTYPQTSQIARTDCVPYVYSESTTGTIKELTYLMEHRSFGKLFLSNRKGIFERHEGDIRLVVTIKNNKVIRGMVTFSGNDVRKGKPNVIQLRNWQDVCRIAQAYGD